MEQEQNGGAARVSLREQMQMAQAQSGRGGVRTGFETDASFELLQRESRLLSRSEMVPEMFREKILIKKGPQKGTYVDNPSAIPNCVLALNMANRMNMDVLGLMQNLLMISGRLSWSSQYVIASVNRTGRFSAVQYDITKSDEEEQVEYQIREWNDQARRMETLTRRTKIKNMTCVAWAIEKATGQRVESPQVSIRMAVLEGWYNKEGSKWKTMPDVMLRYRAASFFGKFYVPESMFGLPSEDEVEDGAATGESAEFVNAGQGVREPSAAGAGGPAETGGVAAAPTNAGNGQGNEKSGAGEPGRNPSGDRGVAQASPAAALQAAAAQGSGQVQGQGRVINARRGGANGQGRTPNGATAAPQQGGRPVARGGDPREEPPFYEPTDEELLAADDAFAVA